MPQHRTMQFFGTVVAVLLIAELGLHVFSSRLPEARDWYANQPQYLVGEMDRLDAMGLRSDVVFVGSSMIGQGVDVPVIEQGLASVSRVHNAALDAAQPSVVRRWVTEEVLPRIQPRRVVWGVSSWDFNPNVPEPAIERYGLSRAIRPGVFGAADRLLAAVSMVSRHRSTLRLDRGLQSLIGGWEPHGEPVDDIPAEELLSRQQVNWDNQTPDELTRFKRHALADWEIGEAEKDAFIETITRLQDSGIETVVVLVPVPSEHVNAHPRGQSDYDDYRTEMLALGQDLGFVVLDFGRSYADASFKDYSHLRPDAANRFSADLADALAELGW